MGRAVHGLSNITHIESEREKMDRTGIILNSIKDGLISINTENGEIYSKRIKGKEVIG